MRGMTSLGVVIGGLTLVGCATESTLSSVAVGETAGYYATDQLSGPVYYLPVSYLEIEGKTCPPPAEDKNSNSSKESTDKEENGRNEPSDVNVTVSPTTNINVSTAAALAKKAASSSGSGSSSCPAGKFLITVTETALADPDHAFVARMDLANFSTEKPDLKINSAGLLSTVSSVSKNESREALVSFSEAIGLGLGLAGESLITTRTLAANIPDSDKKPKPPKPKPFKVRCKVSRLDSFSVATPYCDGNVEGLNLAFFGAGKTDDTKLSTCEADAGLCFRSRRDVLLTVGYSPHEISALFKINLVDPDHSYTVSAYRRPFVQTTTTMTFENGVLTGFKGDYPSTGGAIVTLPADFVGGIFTGIGNALDFQKESVTSEAELIKAQTELLKAQAELEAARNSADTSTSTDTDDD